MKGGGRGRGDGQQCLKGTSMGGNKVRRGGAGGSGGSSSGDGNLFKLPHAYTHPLSLG